MIGKKNSSNSSEGSCKGNTKQEPAKVSWCFTLNNYTTEEVNDILSWSSKSSINYCKYIIFGKEICPTTGTPHLQGYLKWGKKKRFTELKKINPRISWKAAKGNKDANNLYCDKDRDYYIDGRKIRQPKVLKKEELRGWQRKIVDICETEPDDRTINWIWDDGNFGKTACAKYIYTHFKCVFVNGKSADIKCAIARYYEANHYYPDIVLWLAPRNAEGYINYGTLEEIKDGLIFSGKYESGCFLMPCPHIFVFCNFEPDLSQLTEDRWNVLNTPAIAPPAPLDKYFKK